MIYDAPYIHTVCHQYVNIWINRNFQLQMIWHKLQMKIVLHIYIPTEQQTVDMIYHTLKHYLSYMYSNIAIQVTCPRYYLKIADDQYRQLLFWFTDFHNEILRCICM